MDLHPHQYQLSGDSLSIDPMPWLLRRFFTFVLPILVISSPDRCMRLGSPVLARLRRFLQGCCSWLFQDGLRIGVRRTRVRELTR